MTAQNASFVYIISYVTYKLDMWVEPFSRFLFPQSAHSLQTQTQLTAQIIAEVERRLLNVLLDQKCIEADDFSFGSFLLAAFVSAEERST